MILAVRSELGALPPWRCWSALTVWETHIWRILIGRKNSGASFFFFFFPHVVSKQIY